MAIGLTFKKHVAQITIDRPEKLGALDIAHLQDLRAALIKADADPRVRVVVLTSSTPRAFSTGADIGGIETKASVAEAYGYDLERSGDGGLYVRLLDFSNIRRRKPLIGAVQGYCLGGGLELALQCDLLVAAQNAQFGLPEVATGSLPGAGGVGALLRVLPRHVAAHMALTAERLLADRAYHLGLVSALYPNETFEEDVAALAERIGQMGPLSVQLVKMLMDQSDGLSPAQGMQLSELAWGILRDTEDRAEGRAAFLARRRPEFHGR